MSENLWKPLRMLYKISLTDLLRLFETNIELANWGRVIHQTNTDACTVRYKDRLTLSAKRKI